MTAKQADTDKTTDSPKTDEVTIYHPTLADVTKKVPAGSVDTWEKSGWRKTPISKD